MLVDEKTTKSPWFGLGVLLILFGLLSGTSRFWVLDGPYISPSGSYIAIVGAALCFINFIFGKDKFSFDTYGFAVGLGLLFFTDWICRHYSFFQGPAIRGEIFLGALISFWILKSNLLKSFHIILALAVLLLFYCFFSESAGRIIFSDDHATFYYRLQLLKDNFPKIPFYNPLWNAGLDARDFFATGSLNFFIIFSPFIYLFPLEASYNLLVTTLLFVGLPLSLYLSTRIFEQAKLSAPICSLLGLSIGLNWYKWGLKYGTLGFVTACVLMPLVLALAIQFITRPEKINNRTAILFTLLSSLMLCWSASAIALLPILVVTLASIKRLIKFKPILLSALLLVCLNLPWMLVFWSASNVGSFLNREQSSTVSVEAATDDEDQYSRTAFRHKAGGIDFNDALRTLRSTAHATNPLILIFTLPGIFLLRGATRYICLSLFAWLLFLGSVAVPLKPQLELDRMLLVASLLGTIPASLAIAGLLKQASTYRRWDWLLPACLTCGFILAGPLVSGSFLRNRTLEQYHFRDSSFDQLVTFLKEREDSGRLLFAGCVVHELSHGHLAPLTLFANTPLIASSHVHNLWRYKDVFPPEVLKAGDKGKQEYMNTLNVTGILAHDSEQRAYFRKRKELFEETWRSENFVHYQRKNYKSNYFLEGKGEILGQSNNQVRLKLEQPDAIIKFRYFPFVTSSDCSVAGHSISEDTTLISLSNCTVGKEVVIEASAPWKRIGM